MNHRLIHHMALIGAACLAFASVCAPACAQMIVYDPSNYAQNVLHASRDGKIDKLAIKEGDQVQQGALIATLAK